MDGYVREINDDFFDWFIIDEDEMIRFFDGMPFRPITEEKSVVVSKVSCQVPRPGPYYLLLDIGSRQNDRQVEVVCAESLSSLQLCLYAASWTSVHSPT